MIGAGTDPEATPSECIVRLKAPVVEDLDRDEYEVSVLLSSAPTSEWQRLFRDTEDRTTLCHPALVPFTGNRLRFTCRLGDAREWLTFIDRWIAAANGDASVAWKAARATSEPTAWNASVAFVGPKHFLRSSNVSVDSDRYPPRPRGGTRR